MYFSAPLMPTRFDTSETVIGLSPDITLISTLFSLNHFIVSIASERILSTISMILIAFLNPYTNWKI